MLFKCWPTVEDGGPTFKQHWVDVSSLKGCLFFCRTQKSSICWLDKYVVTRLPGYGFFAFLQQSCLLCYWAICWLLINWCVFNKHNAISQCCFKIHRWRQSIVKTVDSDLRIYCYFLYWPCQTLYTGFIMTLYNCTANVSLFIMLTIGFQNFVYIKSFHVLIPCILSRRKNSITIDL